MENPIKLGDIVTLKSNPNFVMTVIDETSPTMSKCAYFFDGELKTVILPNQALDKS